MGKTKNNHSKGENDYFGRVIKIASLTFGLALIFTVLSEYFIARTQSIFFATFFLVVIILLNIVFDIVGTAVAAAEEAPFHAMASKKIRGAKESYLLVRNADKVANFCNDVIGDIAGTISGALGISLALQIGRYFPGHLALINILITSFIAAVIVAGKALGKKIAIEKAEKVIALAGITIYHLEKTMKVKIIKDS
ncbi:hypothetical protein [Carboxydothermus ferrireducens]|uniref:Mg2+/Co2+ transporter CorB n=1 Tax=Carboxydothermus ferrireducens DSM 11255 TaxID=1119529 RepID=A0ABX2RBX5_9THEO|nr:hypothetical protein [Carboxydothermus ferrireducens]NYE58699.1 Mg2+/Co2+ transporter CorB [Carboxydothermus ferrireducens DSM 11255]